MPHQYASATIDPPTAQGESGSTKNRYRDIDEVLYHPCPSEWMAWIARCRRNLLPEDEKTRLRKRLQIIHDSLAVALDRSDALDAHLLSAKIEDSRVCVQDMIEKLR